MAQKLNLGLKQTQNLLMTPQLQQAIKMLTLTHLEMTHVISEHLVENPLLEEEGNISSGKDLVKDPSQQEATSDNFSGPEIVEGSKEDFDWDKYVDTYNSSSSTPNVKERVGKDDAPNYENMVSRGMSLQEHLEWQLRMDDLTDEEWKFAEQVIYNLKDDGYLAIEKEDLFKNSPLSQENSIEVLNMIKMLDPVGCGSADLQECLQAQALALETPSALINLILKNHMDDFLAQENNKMKQALGVNDEQLREALLIIHSFHPKPGRLIGGEDIQYVVPDIYIKDTGKELVVHLNDEGVPRLKVSNLYQRIVKNEDKSSKANEYVQNKLRDALFLIKSIENRQKTIEKVAHSIIRHQPDFFKRGAEFLRPMILKDVANEIGVHESTVSRATTNKFVHTPLGIFELKFFFNSGVGGKNGGMDIASEGLRIKIKDLIAKEDPQRPLSDQKLANMLSAQGINVARRTVAKYREMLDIAPSSKRKKKKA